MQKVNAASVPRSERILGRANCLATDSVGDCLRIRATKTGNRFEVEKVDISLPGNLPAVSILVKKYTATDCIVQFHGPMRNVYSSLSVNNAYFVGIDGRLSKQGDVNYPPIGGSYFFQQMGISTSINEFIISPLGYSFGGPFSQSFRFIQQSLIGSIDGFNVIFMTSLPFSHGGVNTESLFYNGQLLEEGVGNDYIASESGGVGTGYDTVTTLFVPRVGQKLKIDYTPNV